MTNNLSELREFENFMRQREDAAQAYVSGDFVPLSRIAARLSPATLFGPRGGYEHGAEQVYSAYEHGAEAFESGAENKFEILQMAASDGIAYWVGFQRAATRVKGKKEPVSFHLRVTEVFRREGGEWRLVQRHADPLFESKTQ